MKTVPRGKMCKGDPHLNPGPRTDSRDWGSEGTLAFQVLLQADLLAGVTVGSLGRLSRPGPGPSGSAVD